MIQPNASSFEPSRAVGSARVVSSRSSAGSIRFGQADRYERSTPPPDRRSSVQKAIAWCRETFTRLMQALGGLLSGSINRPQASSAEVVENPSAVQADPSPAENPQLGENVVLKQLERVQQSPWETLSVDDLQRLKAGLTLPEIQKQLAIFFDRPESEQWLKYLVSSLNRYNAPVMVGTHKFNNDYIKASEAVKAELVERMVGPVSDSTQASLDKLIEKASSEERVRNVELPTALLDLYGIEPPPSWLSLNRSDRLWDVGNTAMQSLGIEEARGILEKAYHPEIKGTPVGKAIITDRQTGQPVEAVVSLETDTIIHLFKGTKRGDIYRVYVDGEELGYTGLTNHTRAENPDFRFMFVEHMRATYGNDRYKGIGTALHQVAIEASLRNGGGGQVRLEADSDKSAIFHAISGFRPEGVENKAMDEAVAQWQRDKTVDLLRRRASVGTPLGLSAKTLQAWKEKIEQSPILDP